MSSDNTGSDRLADRYVLLERLGRGGMAVVHRAWDEKLEVFRAIKILIGRFARQQRVRERLHNEAKAMARLSHPNIVTVQEMGEDGGRVFLVMELTIGGSLMDRLTRDGPLSPRTASSVVLGVLSALQLAHEHGIVHRDIKPHNILLDAAGVPKVTDFGIARLDDGGMTRTGAVMGTLAYMPPEQKLSARRVDARADIYATGATFFALLTGREPFDLYAAGIDEQIAADFYKEVPPPLAVIIRRATAFKPEDRYATAAEMAQVLGEAIDALPTETDATPLVHPDQIARAKSLASMGPTLLGDTRSHDPTLYGDGHSPSEPDHTPRPQPTIDETPPGAPSAQSLVETRPFVRPSATATLTLPVETVRAALTPESPPAPVPQRRMATVFVLLLGPLAGVSAGLVVLALWYLFRAAPLPVETVPDVAQSPVSRPVEPDVAPLTPPEPAAAPSLTSAPVLPGPRPDPVAPTAPTPVAVAVAEPVVIVPVLIPVEPPPSIAVVVVQPVSPQPTPTPSPVAPAVVAPAPPPAPTPAPAPAPSTVGTRSGNWTYQLISRGRPTADLIAVLRADGPVVDRNGTSGVPEIIVTCSDRKLAMVLHSGVESVELILAENTMTSEHARVQIVDAEGTEGIRMWMDPALRSELHFPAATKWFARLQSSGTVRMSYSPFDSSEVTARFTNTGMGPVTEALTAASCKL